MHEGLQARREQGCRLVRVGLQARVSQGSEARASGGAEVQRRRGAEAQRCRGAEVQGRRGAGARRTSSAASCSDAPGSVSASRLSTSTWLGSG
eukprot:scaffold87555_cov36-Phaeocystis_antarctica.AAC.1